MTNIDYLYNPELMRRFLDFDAFEDRKLSFEVIDKGTILPYKHKIDGKYSQDSWGFGGIVDGNGNYLRRSFVNSSAGQAYTPESIQHSSETVIYL